MTVRTIAIGWMGGLVLLTGCQSPQPPPPQKPVTPPPPALVGRQDPLPPTPPPAPVPRKRTAEQMQLLQDFALKESPQIHATIQMLRAEMTDSGNKLKKLRADLLEFDRNPDTDDDYKALVAGLKELRHAYDAIFDKLEDAYIAAKKYEASPSRKDYQQMMKRALEDGIQDANMATERYKAMTRQK